MCIGSVAWAQDDGPPGRPGIQPSRPGFPPGGPGDAFPGAPGGPIPPTAPVTPPPDFSPPDAARGSSGGPGSPGKVVFHLTGQKKKIEKPKDLHELLSSSENWKTPPPHPETEEPEN